MNREEHEALAARLDAILEWLQGTADPEVMGAVAELVDGLRSLHAEALGRLVDLVAEDPDRFGRALDDPVVSNLLLLYDLVVVDERGRAARAIEEVRELARAHGGEIQLLGAEEGVVRVRLHGACHGCPSSAATLTQGLERALAETLPGFVRLEVAGAEGGAPSTAPRTERQPTRRPRGADGPPPDPASAGIDRSVVPRRKLVQLERRLRGNGAGGSPRDAGGGDGPPEAAPVPRHLDVAPLDEVPARALFGRVVDNHPVLLVRTGGELRAYRNACPGSLLPLHLGALQDGEIRCPWHGCRFEAATGRRLDGDGPGLDALEPSVVAGRVRVEAP